MGPHPLEPDRRSVRVPVLNGRHGGWKWARIDADQYGRVVAFKWYLVTKGYVGTTTYDAVTGHAVYVALHRMVMDAPDGSEVDHRFGNKLDNRRCVLRFCTHSQNMANARAARRRRVSRYRGVAFHQASKKWQAKTQHHGVTVYGGIHKTEEAAARSYNDLARRIFGPFARLNRIRKQVASQRRKAA